VSAWSSTRLDFAAASARVPLWSGSWSDPAESAYQWRLTHGRTDLGFGLSTFASTPRPLGEPLDGMASAMTVSPVLNVGMRYRTSESFALFAGASSVRVPGPTGSDAYAGQVGVEWMAAQSRWSFAYGGVGTRVGSDSRMAVRLRRGGVALYVSSAF